MYSQATGLTVQALVKKTNTDQQKGNTNHWVNKGNKWIFRAKTK